MRLRTLLATAVAGTLITGAAGVTGGTAQATPPSSPDLAGTVVSWGETDSQTEAAKTVPADLTAPVAALATTVRSTAAVTADGQLRVWGGGPTSTEVTDAPPGVTDAVAVALTRGAGLVLHRDGRVTGWGSPFVAEVPEGLRAKAIALGQGDNLAYAVRVDGTLAVWGNPEYVEGFPPPTGLSGLVDVAAHENQVLALRTDGTVAAWGFFNPAFDQANVPDFGSHKVTRIAAGPTANGVVLDDGTIRTWGQTVPPGQPDFAGSAGGPSQTVVGLALGINGGAVTADGAVHTWGTNAAVNTRPGSLTGKSATSIVVGDRHAAVILTAFRAATKPTIAGTPQVGQTLTATPATYSLTPDAAVTGQWYAGSESIAGQTGTTLKLTDAMVGKSISYRSTATRGAETVTSTSDEVGPVTAAPPAKVASTTALSVVPATGEFGTARTATATVAKTGGLPTGTVTFKLDGVDVTATLVNGTATFALPNTLAVGTHSVTATYSGDATTNASASAAVAVTVAKAASKVAAGKAKVKGKTKKVAKKVTLSLTVDTADGVSPAGKVTVALKGKTKKKVTVSVDADGTAKVTFKKVKRGKYQAKLAYAGNATVAASTATAKLKI